MFKDFLEPPITAGYSAASKEFSDYTQVKDTYKSFFESNFPITDTFYTLDTRLDEKVKDVDLFEKYEDITDLSKIVDFEHVYTVTRDVKYMYMDRRALFVSGYKNKLRHQIPATGIGIIKNNISIG